MTIKHRPIIFSSDSVASILDGMKTNTRRVVNFGKKVFTDNEHALWNDVQKAKDGSYIFWGEKVPENITPELYKDGGFKCPYGDVGDRLWVRETYAIERVDGFTQIVWKADKRAQYIENGFKIGEPFWLVSDYKPRTPWKSPRFMPRWASRLTLEIVSVDVERLHGITNAGVRAEGITAHHPPRKKDDLPTSRSAFARHWDMINKKRGYKWDVNPWVWVVGFKVAES